MQPNVFAIFIMGYDGRMRPLLKHIVESLLLRNHFNVETLKNRLVLMKLILESDLAD